MENYKQTDASIWQGRKSDDKLYLHENVAFGQLDAIEKTEVKAIALLGYCCDEGVKRNQGRVGAAAGPKSIRQMLSGLANHWRDFQITDFGNLNLTTEKLEAFQLQTAKAIASILIKGYFPILLGGGHDLAYAHFKGIRDAYPHKKKGILNLDAHFDLRNGNQQATSGTPFWQIAQEEDHFNYCCLGIQKAANNAELFKTAEEYNVHYLLNSEFNLNNWTTVQDCLDRLLDSSDLVYLSIDLDGFSSAYAPGVSAPSPMGFHPDIAVKVIQYLVKSQKLISTDLVELNPQFDLDNATARLASRLIYELIDSLNTIPH